jgi:hypothetical protein
MQHHEEFLAALASTMMGASIVFLSVAGCKI